MPTYEYVCDACKAEWELEQRMSDAPVKKCPKCGKLKAHRQISQGNFILKGGGWYTTGGYGGAPDKVKDAASSTSSSSSSDSGSSSGSGGSSGSVSGST